MYTKGEWKEEIDLTDNGQHILVIYTGESYEHRDEIIASVNSLVGSCDGREAEANAHLIAAAPDYHKLVSDIIDNTLFSNEPPSKTEWNKWRKRAVEIHNKAEGK
jgi:glutamine synthetase type III